MKQWMIQNFKSLFYGFVFTFWIGQAACLNAKPYNLDEYIAAAIQSNETKKINDTQISIYESKIGQSESTMKPQVKLIGAGTYQDHSSESPSVNATTSALKVNLTQPLLGLYKNRDAVKVAELQSSAALLSGDDAVMQLKLSLNEAYHSLLLAIDDVRIYEGLRKIAMERVKETDARVRIGRSKKSDLYSVQSQLATVEAQLEQAKVTSSNARTALSQLSGLPEFTEISDSVQVPKQADNVDSYLTGVDQLPGLRALTIQKSASLTQSELARSQNIPDLDFVSNYYVHREVPLDKVKWDIGLQLTWSIYDGGLIREKVRESQSQAQIYELQGIQKRRLLELKVRQVHEQFTAALRQIPIWEKAVSLSQRSYDAIEKDYKMGLATILDVIQATNSVSEAKKQYDHQVIAAKSQYVSLLMNSGRRL